MNIEFTYDECEEIIKRSGYYIKHLTVYYYDVRYIHTDFPQKLRTSKIYAFKVGSEPAEIYKDEPMIDDLVDYEFGNVVRKLVINKIMSLFK